MWPQKAIRLSNSTCSSAGVAGKVGQVGRDRCSCNSVAPNPSSWPRHSASKHKPKHKFERLTTPDLSRRPPQLRPAGRSSGARVVVLAWALLPPHADLPACIPLRLSSRYVGIRLPQLAPPQPQRRGESLTRNTRRVLMEDPTKDAYRGTAGARGGIDPQGLVGKRRGHASLAVQPLRTPGPHRDPPHCARA